MLYHTWQTWSQCTLDMRRRRKNSMKRMTSLSKSKFTTLTTSNLEEIFQMSRIHLETECSRSLLWGLKIEASLHLSKQSTLHLSRAIVLTNFQVKLEKEITWGVQATRSKIMMTLSISRTRRNKKPHNLEEFLVGDLQLLRITIKKAASSLILEM